MRTANTFAGALFAALAVWLLVHSDSLLAMLGGEASASTAFLARRVSLVFAGLAVLTFATRDVAERAAVRGIAGGLATSFLTLAVLGSVELARGFASPMILGPVSVELAFGVVYVRIARGA